MIPQLFRLTTLLLACSLCQLTANAKTILVKDAAELSRAEKNAAPGDVIILRNGVWNNTVLDLTCKGTSERPITFKAQTAGKVLLTGQSKLKLGGSFIIVDGLSFTNGYAGKDAVISFRSSKDQLANNCRVTNSGIKDYNNPQRMDENTWVYFYGKNNRLDHSSFQGKTNMGVLLAVILDDERSRENYHSIDHNYFGERIPLASNTGEMIRVGVSQHCEFNSNTRIVSNYFEHCDGETEIVSIKSGSNIVSNNLFVECQGSVVLRHGNDNTVENNVFLGNNKPGTGGIRVINKGQWVVNNFLYQCTGTGFRSPLAVMNGVPNSPAHRYVTAQDAVIANNSFYECAPLSFCEGSDAERSEAPRNILFQNNIVYNKTPLVYHAYDNMSGFRFAGNAVNLQATQQLQPGFIKAAVNNNRIGKVLFPVSTAAGTPFPDSLQPIAAARINGKLSNVPGFSTTAIYKLVLKNAFDSTGAKWFNKSSGTSLQKMTVRAANVTELLTQLTKQHNKDITILLTGDAYEFKKPINFQQPVTLTASHTRPIRFVFKDASSAHLFQVLGGNRLTIRNLQLDLGNVLATGFITTDTNGSSSHTNINITGSAFRNYNGRFFNAAKSSVADSIIIRNNIFASNKGTLLDFTNETDKKGYYNVEKLVFSNNTVTDHQGQLLTMLRGGNDESTMGPTVYFSNNKISNSQSTNNPLIHFYGTQYSTVTNNTFTNANPAGTVLLYEDVVKAKHLLQNNSVNGSGKIVTNQWEVKGDY